MGASRTGPRRVELGDQPQLAPVEVVAERQPRPSREVTLEMCHGELAGDDGLEHDVETKAIGELRFDRAVPSFALGEGGRIEAA